MIYCYLSEKQSEMYRKLNNIPTLPPEGNEKKDIKHQIRLLKKELIALQEKLFAQNKSSILIILQGMDTSGKDNAVKHIFSGVNPAGCKVKSFKVPSEEEQAHHFLWRISKECPERRYIQLFNRSQYEDVLENVIQEKMNWKTAHSHLEEIDAFEKGLQNDHTRVLKFYLHVSKEIQLKRLAKRKKNPEKQWKYDKQDQVSIERHGTYLKIYEKIVGKQQSIPWQVIPADKKWYKNYLIIQSVVRELKKLILDESKTKKRQPQI